MESPARLAATLLLVGACASSGGGTVDAIGLVQPFQTMPRRLAPPPAYS